MADPDAAPVQHVLNVAPRPRVADVEHYRQADGLRAAFELPKQGPLGHSCAERWTGRPQEAVF